MASDYVGGRWLLAIGVGIGGQGQIFRMKPIKLTHFWDFRLLVAALDPKYPEIGRTPTATWLLLVFNFLNYFQRYPETFPRSTPDKPDKPSDKRPINAR